MNEIMRVVHSLMLASKDSLYLVQFVNDTKNSIKFQNVAVPVAVCSLILRGVSYKVKNNCIGLVLVLVYDAF